jgi:hypothetical protein
MLVLADPKRQLRYLVNTETGLIWKPVTISNAKDENFNSPPELWVY